MGPRKRVKPNPKAEASKPTQPEPQAVPLPQESSEPEEPGLQDRTGTCGSTQESPVKPVEVPPSSDPGIKTTQSTKAWYGGTWPRAPKAAPIAKIAKEGINTATGVISSVVDATTSTSQQSPQASTGPRNSSLYLSRTLGASTRSLPLTAATTKAKPSSSGLSRTPDVAESSDKGSESKQSRDANNTAPSLSDNDLTKGQLDGPAQVAEKAVESQNLEVMVRDAKTSSRQPLDRQAGWLGWFSQTEKFPSRAQVPNEETSLANATHEPMPDLKAIDTGKGNGPTPEKRRNSDPSPRAVVDEDGKQHPRSWLGLWGNSPAVQDKNDPKPSKDNLQGLSDTSTQAPAAAAGRDQPTAGTTNAGGWAFWSRSAGSEGNKDGRSSPVVGELAVSSSTPQSKPKTTVIDGDKGEPRTIGQSRTGQKSGKPEANGEVKQPLKELKTGTITTIKAEPALPKLAKAVDSKNPPKQQHTFKNLILPSFRKTFHLPETPGFLQQLGNLLYRSTSPEPKHVSILRDPPRIKKALAIGVHGYFPTPFFRSVLGQPTGTSIRFADFAANAIRKWASRMGHSCEVEKIALEGEGKIEERVDLLWKLMLNWLEDIRKADFILIACHSQGVPVAIMLIAKLIAFGCVSGARIGVCAMAGVNLGPFADYKSRWISGSAGELFDFADPKSKVSKDYQAALDTVLKFGVRVLYIGSIDDQLVSLEVRTLAKISRDIAADKIQYSHRLSALLIIPISSAQCLLTDEFMRLTCKPLSPCFQNKYLRWKLTFLLVLHTLLASL